VLTKTTKEGVGEKPEYGQTVTISYEGRVQGSGVVWQEKVTLDLIIGDRCHYDSLVTCVYHQHIDLFLVSSSPFYQLTTDLA
jgi:hypothetical protein